MRLFPAFFFMDNAHITVFGGGEEARRKVRLLTKTQAHITVIVDDEIDGAFAEEFAGRITIAPRGMAGQALDRSKFAIIACRTEKNTDQSVEWAREYGVPINVVDQPELCDFTVPSMLERGEIVAAVGSGGAAPVLAKKVRTQLEALMPQSLGPLSKLAKAFRPAVYAALKDGTDRRQFWESALSGKPAEFAHKNDISAAQTALESLLDDFARAKGRPGPVHIVGAGPGDPELLTLKAFRLIQNADVVYFDKLVSAEILNMIRRDADQICVGKKKSNHTMPQEDIHKLMVAAARQGKRVVRLKGGDPFVFGRGGEEVDALRAEGLDADIVPGISAALGCAASTGVPLTHRDHAQTLTLVTGHAKMEPGKPAATPDLDWPMLAKANQTVVVFMGLGTAPSISKQLIGAGRAPSTPVVVVENGTRPDERHIFSTLGDLPVEIEKSGIAGPALLIIGEVAGLPAKKIRDISVEAAL
ncbi:MAG: siroheme synthase CysG [Pseudomonadota bacterium]